MPSDERALKALRCLVRIRCHTGAPLLLWHNTKGRIIMKNFNLRTLCRVAVLIALEIVFERFLSISTSSLRIGIAFVPIALCGILYGPVWTGVASGIADVLGTFLMPYGLYPPITLTAILTGVSLGLFLHRKNVKFFPHVVACTLVNTIGLSLALQSYWLSILNNTPYLATVSMRAPQCAVHIALYLVLIPLLQKLALRLEYQT